MAKFSTAISINAPKQKVWEVLADLGSIYKWNPGVSQSYSTSPETVGEGAMRHCDLQNAKGSSIGYLEERAFDWRDGDGFTIDVYENRKWIVESRVADRTLDSLVQMAIQIGADAPEIGIKLLVSQFDEKDWDDNTVLESFTNFMNQQSVALYLQGNSEIFQKVAPKVPREAFGHESIVLRITISFLSALWLGLTAPKQVDERINMWGRSQHEDQLFESGLQRSPHSREELIRAALDTVRAYEAEREKLREASAPLVNYIYERRSTET